MSDSIKCLYNRVKGAFAFWLVWVAGHPLLQANPTGGTVGQGAASFSSSGSTFTINQSSANAFINWNTFNIAAGETTTFNQPSANSLVWNQINDANPSQILGNLNANGYVVLQNQNGFFIGGSAVIDAHGLIMTTSPTPAPNLDSGGAWSFSAPPPLAKIVNYGQINLTGGGSGFLIASDIENNGTISTPGGKIGLYAGEKVLVSTTPDGRGLSAEVTLPQGSVDNEGQLIADGGTIAALAQTVNQNGLVQANSIQNVNGVIELVASDAVNLGANSTISAQGGTSGASAGGSVTVKSGNTFADQAGSVIDVAGGTQAGNGGQVEISALQMGGIQTRVTGQAAAGYLGGKLMIDPTDVEMDDAYVNNLNNEISGGLSEIDVTADHDIDLDTVWITSDASSSCLISLVAGHNINLDSSAGISAGQNVSLSLQAGTELTSAAKASPGNDGIYLAGNTSGGAFITAQNGNINLTAANEIQLGWGGAESGDGANLDYASVTTTAQGNITVQTSFGDVNTGSNPGGFLYSAQAAPYYSVSPSLGGISTAAGGNVTINAGGNVYSYVPSGSDSVAIQDGGTGAFGSQAGNVTITAGGGVFGHYVLANGVGSITAEGGDVGTPSGADTFALSLIDGNWTVNAPNGNIYLQEVRNPNGVFDDLTGGSRGQTTQAGKHLFNYGGDDAVSLNAGDGVYLTDLNLPRAADASTLQVIYPSTLDISAGSGGVTLQGDITLFPSSDQDQNLNITTTAQSGGSLVGDPNTAGTTPQIIMSDSAQTRWVAGNNTFGVTDHGTLADEPNELAPVVLNIDGNMDNLNLFTTKETQITVGGNMIDCGFSGQNLQAGDTTSIRVGGEIYDRSSFTFLTGINVPTLPITDLPNGLASSWDDVFYLALDPSKLDALTTLNLQGAQLTEAVIAGASYFGSSLNAYGQWVVSAITDEGFTYNPSTGRLGFTGAMGQSLLSILAQPITVLHLVNGAPVIDPKTGKFETDTYNWVPPAQLQTLFADSQGAPNLSAAQLGYELGGPGKFFVSAGSMDLGNSFGIVSCGSSDTDVEADGRFQNLASVAGSGADITVSIVGDLSMFTSAICAIDGGSVSVNSIAGSLDLGSSDLVGISSTRALSFGVYTSGGGDVNVSAFGNINVDGSRIATFNGGNITVTSQTGSVDAGTGGSTISTVPYYYVNANGQPAFYKEDVVGSGIDALTFSPLSPEDILAGLVFPPNVADLPGNITITTPQGNIMANSGGILQESLRGDDAPGPYITLTAGTRPTGTLGDPGYSAGYVGDIDLGDSGVIGGTVNADASGSINGLIFSRQDSNVSALQHVVVTILAGGQADVTGSSVGGLIIGATGANVSGGAVTADVLSQNASVNGASGTSTLGSSAGATATSQAAAQQASADTKQQVATDTSGDDDKKKKKLPALKKIKRVTVLLSAATPR